MQEKAAGSDRREAPARDPGADTAASPTASWENLAPGAILGLFLLALVAALALARPILLPIASAFVVGMMLGPLSSHAARLGIPALVSALTLWLLAVLVFYGGILLVSAPVVGWIGKAPEIAQSIRDKLQVLDRPIAALQDLQAALLPAASAETGVKVDVVSVLQPALSVVTPALGQLLIFFGTLFFSLLGRTHLRHAMVGLFDARPDKLRALKAWNEIEHELTRYLSVVAAINLVVGAAAALIAWAVGLPNPIAWGVLGFILNFIPYLGAVMMELAFFAVGLVTFQTLGHALAAPAMYLAFTAVEGHFVTPGIMGRQLYLNPLAVFLSLVFWTWLWGPFGAFLAVPILIIVLVAAHHLFPHDDPVLPG